MPRPLVAISSSWDIFFETCPIVGPRFIIQKEEKRLGYIFAPLFYPWPVLLYLKSVVTHFENFALPAGDEQSQRNSKIVKTKKPEKSSLTAKPRNVLRARLLQSNRSSHSQQTFK